MKQRVMLAVIAGLAALGALGTWWWSTHERVEDWVDLPRRGEITYNPLYVLGLALDEDGVAVRSRQRLQLDEVELGTADTVLLLSDPAALTAAEAQRLREWARRGGHLVMRTPVPGPLRKHSASPLLDGLVELLDTPSQCEPLEVQGEEDHTEFCQGRRFHVTGAAAGVDDAAPPLAWGDEGEGRVHARFLVGDGSIDVLADLDFLTSDKLMDGPHIALTRQLLAPNYRDGTVHLVYDAQLPSLWVLLLRHGWMAWLPLTLLLAAWLWRRMQRFGPQLPSPAGERRSLLEHVAASGEHAWRYGYAHLLHRAVRDAFIARLRRHDPQAAALDGEPQVDLIAQRLRRSHGQVRDALTTPPVGDHAAFRSRVATLIRMRNQL